MIEIPGGTSELQDLCIVIQWNGLSVSKENYGQITKAPKGGVLLKGIRRGQKGRKKKRKGEETGSGAEPLRTFSSVRLRAFPGLAGASRLCF